MNTITRTLFIALYLFIFLFGCFDSSRLSSKSIFSFLLFCLMYADFQIAILCSQCRTVEFAISQLAYPLIIKMN